ncbi:MAG: hypothetical protein IT450_20130 [Phycisphaerales bacterium]|nr:hypothetical protein [Phycisphaerales bacterium]
MRRPVHFAVFALMHLCALAPADVTTWVDLVDPSDNIPQPPPGIISVDVMVDVSLDDLWAASGLRGLITPIGEAESVSIRYAAIPDDPNTPGPDNLFNPGLSDRFITFFSMDRRRGSNGRYTNAGAAYAGRYSPTGPLPVATSHEINLTWFQSPPESDRVSGIGAVGRVSLDVAALLEAHPAAEFVVGAPETANGPIIFLSTTDEGTPGTVSASWNNPNITGVDWAVWYVPEPASVVLLVLAFARRPRNT